jgi:hypothetical protein
VETTFYSNPVPANSYTVTLLSIVFDKVYLPGVYLPYKTVEKAELKERFEGVLAVDQERGRTPESSIMLTTLQFVHNYQELGNIFVGTGKPDYMGILEPETEQVAKDLEIAIYGPPPPNFTPLINNGQNFGVGTDQINTPSWITYPANAYVWANKNNMSLITDNQEFPMPQSMPHEANAELLASYLALSSFSLILPKIRPLNAQEILEVREKMKEDIGDFRTAMLSLTSKYRELVGENPSLEKLKKEAQFLADTIVKPKMESLNKRIETPGEILKSELVDFSIQAPSILMKLKLNPSIEDLLELLKLGQDRLSSGVKRYREANKIQDHSGLALVLKLPKKFKK